jgi:hypothetical protein
MLAVATIIFPLDDDKPEEEGETAKRRPAHDQYGYQAKEVH